MKHSVSAHGSGAAVAGLQTLATDNEATVCTKPQNEIDVIAIKEDAESAKKKIKYNSRVYQQKLGYKIAISSYLATVLIGSSKTPADGSTLVQNSSGQFMIADRQYPHLYWVPVIGPILNISEYPGEMTSGWKAASIISSLTQSFGVGLIVLNIPRADFGEPTIRIDPAPSGIQTSLQLKF
ncbi:MAG: hypothetical protein A2070_07125 [Bdellovibrionales bacterium GWC1_52_8]|nr:MAG: hypothetical protein A2X97_00485 [Bdellovibrionales bacterium GWA1_52_35]OFZ37249.1 MAG: hypothetical protein A2070_07125 [Bdellovibrionales bacterium GWC1_52_8]HCM41291.1 hypothetical protein [Bdellovibrionales bacterium]